MKHSPEFPGKSSLKLIPVLLAGLALAILFIVGGFTIAASQEEHDSFCASCHTQSESTYLQRSTGGQAVDLASDHASQNARCIDCHSGQGIFGRIQAEMLGARNAARWFSGTAVQPAQLTIPIGDANCLKCHQDVTQRGFTRKEKINTTSLSKDGQEMGEEEIGGKGHYHVQLARWQAKAPGSAGSCVTCHTGHATGSPAAAGFMSAPAVQNTCDACHQILWAEDDN